MRNQGHVLTLPPWPKQAACSLVTSPVAQQVQCDRTSARPTNEPSDTSCKGKLLLPRSELKGTPSLPGVRHVARPHKPVGTRALRASAVRRACLED